MLRFHNSGLLPAPNPRRSRLLAWFCFAVASVRLVALETDPKTVDRSPALTIGEYAISHYILDKNFNQFAGPFRARGAAPPAAETAAWFRQFVARHVLQAELCAQGYGDRPEVRSVVERMSRTILTQSNGPLYAALHREEPVAETRLEAEHRLSARVFDALLVRFANEAAARDRLGLPSVAVAPSVTALQAIARGSADPAIDAFEGEIAWPFHPFEEITDLLGQADAGKLVGPIDRPLGLYYILVRGESRRSVPSFAVARQNLLSAIRHTDLALAQRLRRREILEKIQFTPERRGLAQLWAYLSGGEHRADTIDEQRSSAATRLPLATYLDSGTRRELTARDFVRWFNQRFLRQLPRDRAALATAVQDLVIEEFDYRDALAARLDREPKFIEDRRNFELNQIRALYEEEILRPQIAATPAEVLARYEAERGRHLAAHTAQGTLYVYPDQADATAALKSLLGGNRDRAASLAAQTLDRVVVQRTEPPLLIGVDNGAIVAAPDGHVFGPFFNAERHALFVKESTGPLVPLPFVEVETSIRAEIERARMDAMILAHFRRSDALRALRVHVDFAKYGIEDPLRFAAGGSEASAPPAPVDRPPRSAPRARTLSGAGASSRLRTGSSHKSQHKPI